MIIVFGGSGSAASERGGAQVPQDAVEELFTRIRGLLQSLQPTVLIGGLASGADLLFARAALAEGIALRVTLPFDRLRLRTDMIAPLGEPWTGDFDRILSAPGVTVSDSSSDPGDANVAVQQNVTLLDEAEAAAQEVGARAWALVVRSPSDPTSPSVTDDLVKRAEDRRMLVIDLDPQPPAPRSAFIVMPYGRKKDPRANRYIECDPAFDRVYRPLLEDFDLLWKRADLETDSGIIHSAMLSDLANSDLVLADLSSINFNVAYELGIRHVFASRATVLVDPAITSFKHRAKPFDINMIRTHTFTREPEAISDEHAENAIRDLRPAIAAALQGDGHDSPCHEWFDLGHIVRPFQSRAAVPQFRVAGRTVRDRVAAAVRSSDPASMLAEAAKLAGEQEIQDSTRQACRVELAAGLLNEGAYPEALTLLEQAKPAPQDSLHRTWLHKTVMALRRLGEKTDDPAEQRRLWNIARQYLTEGEQAGYQDSETYGIWGGLLKRQLQQQRGAMEDAVAQSLFADMEEKYRLGFESDPEYYTGVNAVMALRWNGRPKDDEFQRDFYELLTISRFLARQALNEDTRDFWAAITLAELALHEALETSASPIEGAIRLYADAARLGRPDQIDSARFQLKFLRICGDPPEIIERALTALSQASSG